MANSDKSYPSCFIWTICPPFISGVTLEAKFHREGPKEAKWGVTLHFEECRIGVWNFELSLILSNRRDEQSQIAVKELITRISLNKLSLLDKTEPVCTFNVGNGFKYFVETRAEMFSQTESDRLVIEIRMSLDVDLPICLPFKDDLKCLAKDMSKLVINHPFHNVDLYSSDNQLFPAHSCILSVRWVKLQNFNTIENTVVKTSISTNLLKEILLYMYSAFFRNWPSFENPAFITELFQVINFFDIDHLRDHLVMSDSSQERVSKKSGFTKSYLFSLHFVSDGLVQNASHILVHSELSTPQGDQYSGTELVLKIKVINKNKLGPWLSYSLKSNTNSRLYVRLSLEIIKVELSENSLEIAGEIPVHMNNCSIDPSRLKHSKSVLFLGCPETFGDFMLISESGEMHQYFRFKICVTDGLSLDQIKSFNSSRPDQKYDVLSQHMYKLRSDQIHADISLESRSSLENTTPPLVTAHRVILTARIPRLHDVMVDLQPDNVLPNLATIDLIDEALPYVLDYIYTGKVAKVPSKLMKPIKEFANKGNIPTLEHLIKNCQSLESESPQQEVVDQPLDYSLK